MLINQQERRSFFVSKFNAVIFHSQSLIRDFMLSEYEVDLCIRHLESTERLRYGPLKIALNERLDEPDSSEAEEGMRAAIQMQPESTLV